MTCFLADRRQFCKIGASVALGAALPTLTSNVAQADGRITSVIELYTSQGCSSCPPADALLHKYAEDPSILALSFHVDYWDYLGWKDTLASAENTQRQRIYASALGNRSVYTPQAIINGRQDVVGSQRNSVESALRAQGNLPLLVTIKKDNPMSLSIAVNGSENVVGTQNAQVIMAYFKTKSVVPVQRGENSGHELAYTNAVSYFTTMGAWQGQDAKMSMPLSEIAKKNADGCAVLIQASDDTGRLGAILGAAKFIAAQA